MVLLRVTAVKKLLIVLFLICTPSICNAKFVLEDELIKVADEIQKQLPRMIDEESRLDSIMAIGNDLYYRVTFVNYNADDFDIAKLRKRKELILKHNMCNNEDTKLLIKKGVSFNYYFFGKDDLAVLKIKINRNKCGY
jgi:hypothetical protein